MSNIRESIQSVEQEYKDFMGIDSFPNYAINERMISEEELSVSNYISVASAGYFFEKKQHILTVISNMNISDFKFLLFHEFTHMLDTEKYVANDKSRYVGITGFSEYHASQIELLQLLGANSSKCPISFTMDDEVTPLGSRMSVRHYLQNKRDIAESMFAERQKTKDINIVVAMIGVLYNYLGLRSICKMYAEDYYMDENNSIFLSQLPSMLFSSINTLMNGWLCNQEIEKSMKSYTNALTFLLQ